MTREKQGDENILSKLIEKIPQKWGIERYVLTPRGEMYHENKEEKLIYSQLCVRLLFH